MKNNWEMWAEGCRFYKDNKNLYLKDHMYSCSNPKNRSGENSNLFYCSKDSCPIQRKSMINDRITTPNILLSRTGILKKFSI